MLAYTVLLFLVPTVHIVSGAGGNYATDWRYGATKGPSTWKTPFPECGWNSQSPINIMTNDAKVDKDLGTLKLGQYQQTDNVTFIMKNRHTDVEFAAKANTGEAKDIPQTVEFDGTKYRLYQFHFHWGSNSHQGSEHQLNSQQYAAELHIIHYNDKYDNVGQAINASDGLLVWGHFLQVTSNNKVENSYFKTIANQIKDVIKADDGTQSVTINLQKLLPENAENRFYHYQGSLTTPPCHQSVKWIVSPTPIRISESLMKDNFRVLRDKAMEDESNVAFPNIPLVDNYRPIQQLNGRTVFANFDEDDICSHSHMLHKPVLVLFIATIVAFVGGVME